MASASLVTYSGQFSNTLTFVSQTLTRNFTIVLFKCENTCTSCLTYNLSALRGVCSACSLPYSVINELCVNPSCGNGALNMGEQCDDGNILSGDHCSSTCMTELFCGDGIVTSPETCDDSNTASHDGCLLCSLEQGYSCHSSPSVCAPVCGDGFIKGAEQCDDSNLSPNDGCS